MRIAIDARLYGIHHRGIGRYLSELISTLAQIGVNDEFVLLVDPRNPQQPINLPKNFCTHFVSASVYTLSEQFAVTAALKQIKPDIIHFPHFSVPFFTPSPFIVTVHDLILHHFPEERATTLPSFIYYFKLQVYKKIISRAIARARRVIVPSQTVADDIVNYYPLSKTKIIIIPLAPGTSALADETQVPKFPYILVVGAAYPHKNLDKAIEAVVVARRELPNHKLLIVGRNDYFMNRLKYQCHKAGINESIHFFGQADDSTLTALYKNADCYLQVSLMEGFGLGPLESLQNGTPAIVANIPIFREVLGSAVTYVNPLSATEIAQAVVSVCKKIPSSVDARAILKKYSWTNTATATLEAYHNAIV